MWHKLREIFGYKDTRRQQMKVTDNEMKEDGLENNIVNEFEENHQDSVQVSGSVTSAFAKSSQENSDKSAWRKYREKWDNEDCFECKVTVSVATFFLMAHICRSFWMRRVHLPPNKVKYIVIGNVSLIGIWLSVMKKEWYDEKQTAEVQNDDSYRSALLDKLR